MASWFDITQRSRRPELMDDPALDESEHVHALRGLARLNFISGSVGIIWRPIRELARRLSRPVRVLDLATGAGDLPIGLWHRARRSGVRLEIAACDLSPQAIAHAQSAAAHGAAAVRFFQLDALHDSLPPDYDVITSSLFLHHLDDDDAVHLLRRMTDAARQMVLVNDLRRCRRGLFLAYVMPQLLCRSRVVHVDGVLSVRAAYTLDEVRELACRAELKEASVLPRWPCRFLLRWQKPPVETP
jgi:2-polyprenyl-3-methyl-5-hydroxy-6-metoxy-1,4-benzoquinol methylase